jgi:hypothetical protein
MRERGEGLDHAEKYLAQLPPQRPVAYGYVLAFERVKQLDGLAVGLPDSFDGRIATDVQHLVVVGPGIDTPLYPVYLVLYLSGPLLHRLFFTLLHNINQQGARS